MRSNKRTGCKLTENNTSHNGFSAPRDLVSCPGLGVPFKSILPNQYQDVGKYGWDLTRCGLARINDTVGQGSSIWTRLLCDDLWKMCDH